MKRFLLSMLAFFFLAYGNAQNITALIQQGDRLEIALNEKGAFEKFKDVIRIQPSNIYALNKCSELCSRIGNREATATVRNSYYTAAQKFAAIALKIEPNNSVANCAMAIALGRVSLEKSGKEKVKAAKEIKKYVDIAIENDGTNYKAWHVLGRWHYEMSCLSFLEKAAVKILLGGMPKSSFAEAVNAFERAKKLHTGFVINYFELARAYEKTNLKEKAIASLNAMLQLPNTTEDDEYAKKSARQLLKTMQ